MKKILTVLCLLTVIVFSSVNHQAQASEDKVPNIMQAKSILDLNSK